MEANETVVTKSQREVELEQQVALLKKRLEVSEAGARLVMLPNKELWRPPGSRPTDGRPDTFRAEPPAPLDTAMAAILKQAGHQSGFAELTCLWCGQQYVGEDKMRAHLTSLHPSLVNPLSTEDALALKVALDEETRRAEAEAKAAAAEKE